MAPKSVKSVYNREYLSFILQNTIGPQKPLLNLYFMALGPVLVQKIRISVRDSGAQSYFSS